jgi:hypothetical protein
VTYLRVSKYQIRQWRDEGKIRVAANGNGNNPKELFCRRELDKLFEDLLVTKN